MAEDMVVKLQAINTAILTDVVRQDQHSPRFEVTGWPSGSYSRETPFGPSLSFNQLSS
jgi:hypothetical protein